jgi:DNA-binding protein HU-beta/integration host factor subunit alpha
MPNLTRREIVRAIYQKTVYPQKQITATVGLTIDTMMRALGEGRNVEFRNFGVFQVKKRLARLGRIPKQPKVVIPIPARAAVKFKIGKTLKRLL